MPGRGRPKKLVRLPGQRGRLKGEKIKDKGMNFRPYIFRTARAAGINNSIKKSSMELLNSIIVDIFRKIKKESGELLENSKGKKIDNNTLKAAVYMILPGQLSFHANEEAQVAVNKFKNFTP